MQVGVLKEGFPGERRVALVPAAAGQLVKKGLDVLVEAGAGEAAGFPDAGYREAGAKLASRDQAGAAEVLLQVRVDLDRLRAGQAALGFADPLWPSEALKAAASRGATLFAMELIPRSTRAQSMDALSSMATVSGYKAVLLAAAALPRMFPMLMTAAGTVAPARVFVVGAGVAGLQAIATARRLGALVKGYDVRPAVKEQVQSLGAAFISTQNELPLETAAAEGQGGYAKAMDEAFYARQRELMAGVLSGSDVVITTAAIPGKRSPILITEGMVKAMPPGSVLVDLAAERGGNCALTRPDETVVVQGVSILGPTNLPATVPFHASQLYARNVSALLLHLLKDGKLAPDAGDEIARETLVARGGGIVHPRVREAQGGGA